MSAQLLKQAVTGQESNVFSALMSRNVGSFDPDAWHVMQERDNSLIRDELLHGAASNAYVYSFNLKGSQVTGISVVGARELAAQYKGIKSRIVATVEKRGNLFIFRTFAPLSIETRSLPELSDETDFYEVVMEVEDIKTGNSIQVRKKESKLEMKRDGSAYERPHFDVIAESKAFRNGVLSVLPQSVIREFKERSLKAGQTSNEETIDQIRAKVAAFATKNAIPVDRQALAGLGYAEISGLGGAARQSVDQFREAAASLGLVAGVAANEPAAAPAPAHAPTVAAAADQSTGEWQPTEAEQEAIRQREIAEAKAAQQATQAPAQRRARSMPAPE